MIAAQKMGRRSEEDIRNREGTVDTDRQKPYLNSLLIADEEKWNQAQIDRKIVHSQ
jgi:hypothetical protein